MGGARRRPGPQRRARTRPSSSRRTPYNKVFTESVPRLKDFWNLPEYAKLLNVHSTAGQRRDQRHRRSPMRRSTSWPRTSRPSSTRAATKQRIQGGRARSGPGLLTSPRSLDLMADTLQTPPAAPPPVERLEAPPAAKRFGFLTDRWLAALFIAPALRAAAVPLDLAADPAAVAVVHRLLGDPRRRLRASSGSTTTSTSSRRRSSHKRAVTTLIFVVGAVGLQTHPRLRDRVPDLAPRQGPRRAHHAVPDPDDALADRRRPVLEVHARRAVRRRELVPEQPRARPRRVADASSDWRCSR